MASLSEADQKILLGENYKAILRNESDSEDTEVQKAFLARKAEESATDQRFNAISLCILGAALVVAGFYLNGTTIGFEKMLGAGMLVAGLLWLAFLRFRAASRSRA